MKDRSILLLASAIIVGALIIAGSLMYSRGGMDWRDRGMGPGMMDRMPMNQDNMMRPMPKMSAEQACTKSGGSFANDTCTCSASTTFSNGMCMDSMGKPAGEMGKMMMDGRKY